MRVAGHGLAQPLTRTSSTLFSAIEAVSGEAVSWYRPPFTLRVVAGLVQLLSGLVELRSVIARAWDTSVRGIPCPAAAPSPRPFGPPLSRQGGEGASASERPCGRRNRWPTENVDAANDVGAYLPGPPSALFPSPPWRERVGPQGRGEGPWHGRSSCQFSGMTREKWWSKRSSLPLPDQVGDDLRGGDQAENKGPSPLNRTVQGANRRVRAVREACPRPQA